MGYGGEIVLGSERFVPFGFQIQRLGLVLVLLFSHLHRSLLLRGSWNQLICACEKRRGRGCPHQDDGPAPLVMSLFPHKEREGIWLTIKCLDGAHAYLPCK